jgi:hypothetical protein
MDITIATADRPVSMDRTEAERAFPEMCPSHIMHSVARARTVLSP